MRTLKPFILLYDPFLECVVILHDHDCHNHETDAEAWAWLLENQFVEPL